MASQPNPRSNARRRRTRVLIGLVIGTGALATSAQGIGIILSFDGTQSIAPAYDPSGTGLKSLFAYAKSFYEDVFEDAHTLTVNFWYADLPTTILGQHALGSQSNGRETVANIRINSSQNWYIDPTPSTDGEFQMSSALRGTSLSGFTGVSTLTPSNLETGYFGGSPTSSPASGRMDMLTVVFHEIGHALGMTSDNVATQLQTADGDYDVNPLFIHGSSLGIRVATASTDIAHLMRSEPLMAPSVLAGVRKLPSHTDLFAMASGSSFTQVDLPRLQYYAGAFWSDGINWSGGRIPTIDDQVSIIGTSIAPAEGLGLSEDAVANSVFLTSLRFRTNGFRLDVASTFKVGLGGILRIDPGGHLQVDQIMTERMTPTGQIQMFGGSITATRSLALSRNVLLLSMEGTNDLLLGQIDNDGIIRALGGSTLVMRSPFGVTWNLDGEGNGRVEADAGDIKVQGGGFDVPTRGAMEVGAGHSIQIDAPWTNWGDILLTGGSGFATRARMAGGTITHNNADSVINASGVSAFETGLVVSAGSFNIQSGGDLTLNGQTLIDGGKINVSNSAVLRIGHQATVLAGPIYSGGGKIVVNAGARLNLGNGATLGLEMENSGVLEIGASPGAVTVPKYAQLASGVLRIELGGYVPGSEFDLMNVEGAAALFGTLEITSLNGFSPQAGDAFTVITYASLTGGFSTITNPSGPANLVFTPTYGPTALTVTATYVPEPASLLLLAALLPFRRRWI